MIYTTLNPDKALIWRITHRLNIPWILSNGLHAGNQTPLSQNWITIGNEDLINRRGHRTVPIMPRGVLNDYIPFYFTPFSPMMYNIHTGRGGVKNIDNNDIVILVSSLYRVAQIGLPFVFTDSHAYPVTANYYNKLDDLKRIDWDLLQRRSFQRDTNDPQKVERYQAEALIYRHMPITAMLGAVCCTERVQQELQEEADRLSVNLDILCRPKWYF